MKKAGNNNSNRSITVPFRLITQSNDYKFVTGKFLNDNFPDDFLKEKSYEGPAKIFDVDKDGILHDPNKKISNFNEFKKHPNIRNKLLEIQKETNSYKTVQQVVIYDIGENSLYFDRDDLQKWPPKLYTKFGVDQTDEQFSRFVRQFDFCDFPSLEEQKQINENDPYLFKFVLTENEKFRAANWIHLKNKHSIFSDIFESVAKNGPTDHDLDFLIKEIKQNIIEIPVDRNNPVYQELGITKAIFKEDPFKHFHPKKIKGTDVVMGYKIFGHFALCCLEFYLDIRKNIFPKFCQNCHKLLPDNVRKNQKFCKREDNLECYKQWRRQARKKDRLNIKIRKRRIIKKPPKRNL